MVQIKVDGVLLDVSEGGELDIILNKSIADFDDISSRNSTFSFDFKLPPTQNNTQLLFGVSDVNAVFDIGQKDAVIMQDGRQYDTGKIFAYESELGGDYTCTYQSGVISWATELDKVKLNELEWRAETDTGTVNAKESFTTARIDLLSFYGYPHGYDITYPIINRNNEYDESAKRPVLHARSLIENMFAKIGWTIEGSFLTSDELTGGITTNDPFGNSFNYQGLAYDPPFNFNIDESTIEAARILATTNRSQDGTQPSTWDEDFILGTKISTSAIVTQNDLLGWYNDEIDGNFATYDTALNEYTAPSNGAYDITVEVGNYEYGFYDTITSTWKTYVYTVSPYTKAPPKVIFRIKDNAGNTLFLQDSGFAPVPSGFTTQIQLTAGQKVIVTAEIIDDAFGFSGSYSHLNSPSLDQWTFKLGDLSSINIQPVGSVSLGEEFVINGHLPDTNCLDILKEFKLAYNLIFTTNEKLKKVTVESWEDFYDTIGNAANYTSKVDLDVKPVINHLSTYSKDVVFEYADDSSDNYTARWNSIYNRIYGQYTQTLIPTDKFNDGENSFKMGLIAPTVQGFLENSNLPTSVIKKEWVDNDDTSINTGYSPRLYYLMRGNIRDNFGNSITGVSDLVGVMESFGNIPIPNDWQLTFNGANGLVARFWSKTLATIQLGIRVKLNLLLSKDEFFNFDFGKPIFLEYPTKIKGYYLIESLNEYKLNDFNTFSVKATLIKYKDFVGVTIDTSQATNVNANTAGTNAPSDPDIVYTISNEGTASEEINRVFTISADGNLNRVIR